ncbi:MAG TPA: glycosyltransferase, partial [Oligoflexia bacterium]|nr:glycosyltransferase [Oligoflexia bacterium]
MSSATSVSIVVPAYNEENVIRDTLTGLLEHLQEGWELIVVNDGS